MATDNVDLPDLSQEAAPGTAAALLNNDAPGRSRAQAFRRRPGSGVRRAGDGLAPCWARASMEVSQLLKLGKGTVVELDRKVGEAIDIYVNDRLVARGEVVLVEDRLGITMTEIIKAGSGS